MQLWVRGVHDRHRGEASATRPGTRFFRNQRTGALSISVRSTAITTGSTTARPSRSVAMTISVTMTIEIADGDRLAFSGAAVSIASVLTAAPRPYAGVGGNSTISSQ